MFIIYQSSIDLVNPEKQYFCDEVDRSKVPLKATNYSLILVLVHASYSLP